MRIPKPCCSISLVLLAAGCSQAADAGAAASHPLLTGAEPVDHLIQQGERHFARLFKLTSGGENAEGYFSNAGDRLVLQHRDPDGGVVCDRIYVTEPTTGALTQVSNGRGVTTCGYFLPGDREVLFASTHASASECPARPDFSRGYVWPLRPEFDIWVRALAGAGERALTQSFGYDAEATVSPRGDRIVFTSSRSGDLELWTCAPDGSDLVQVTDQLGYDGGAFFSHDGKRLVFRATVFTPGAEEEEHAAYRALLADWLVRPSHLEIMLVDADGKNRSQLTRLGGANFAPYFFPDDQRVIFSSNHHEASARNFDIFAIDVDGEELERVTLYAGFDSFPMFSPDGRWLVFASNRGGAREGETNLFLAEWRD